MDMNVVVLSGRLAAPPEYRCFESGSKLLRSLVTVRSNSPRRRVDVVPVTLWDPVSGHEVIDAPAGEHVWVVGTVQRRFWSSGDERKSRLEVVAHHIELKPNEAAQSTGEGVAATTDLRR
ncbi:MAG: single-stranded DNA-binding protein [bacterium]|nr:single-stranded DNA-binding protein [bacterium]